MLKIRLTRRGKKNNAFFRIVVAEHTAPIKGGFLEVLGFLNPHTKEKSFKTDRIEYWIGKGAQCSDTVHNLLVSNGVVKGPKRVVKLKKKPVEEKKEEVSEKKSVAEEVKVELASPVDKEVKETEVAESKKEEIKPEVVKPEPEKKEAEKKEGEEPASSADEEKK